MTANSAPVLDFTDRTVIVTGGAGGFGEAIARAFGGAGANVVVADINEEGAQKVAASLPSAVAVRTDVTKEDDLRAMIATAETSFGGLDVLVNNAGLPHRRAPLTEMSVEDIDFQFVINLRNVVLSSKFALPLLRQRPGSSIVNVSSIGAVRPRPGMLMYSAMKGGIITFTRGLATEVAPDVRVNAVTPVASETGFVKNSLGTDGFTEEMRKAIVSEIPMGRTSNPTDIANGVLFLASDRAAFLTGIILDIDGGRSI
jgi:3-oxoacyl-[acyl-carrier protein] reductase